MRAEFINPFITSLNNTFQMMLNCRVRRGDLSLKQDGRSSHEISGVIGLTGKAVGTVVLSLSREVALKAASILLLAETTEIDGDVLDAVGELTNMVAGGAKAQLETYELAVSLPNVVTGKGHEVHFPSNVTPICINFQTDWGPLTLEVGLTPVPAACAAV
ncbi:chemotaxis protein CheX [Thermopirellula anaerolimosa]